jgi:hypothetical protein
LNAPTTASNAPALNAIPANIATVRSAAENAATTSVGAAKPSTSAAKPSTSRQNKGQDALTAAIDDYSLEALDANIDFNMLSVFIEENYDTYVTSDQYMQDIQHQDFFNLDDLIISPALAGLPAPGNSRQAAPGSSKQVDPASPGQK